jgi:hypothetical protein
VLFSADSRINPRFTAGKWTGVSICHVIRGNRKTTIFTSIVYAYKQKQKWTINILGTRFPISLAASRNRCNNKEHLALICFQRRLGTLLLSAVLAYGAHCLLTRAECGFQQQNSSNTMVSICLWRVLTSGVPNEDLGPGVHVVRTILFARQNETVEQQSCWWASWTRTANAKSGTFSSIATRGPSYDSDKL